MVSTLLFFHSVIRWLLAVGLMYSVFRAARGYFFNKTFSKIDDSLRHWTATVAHIQLILGVILYIKSPIIKFFYDDYELAKENHEIIFFAGIHSVCMLIAVVILTVGSAMAKRKKQHRDKYKTMLVWFSITLLIILLAIPWPFSPLASRPYLRQM